MNLLTIPWRHCRVQWVRTLLLLAVFTLGVASMTALGEVSDRVGEGFEKQLVRFGANIVITPKRESLTISYGGAVLGDVTLEERWIDLREALAGIESMPLRANVAVVAPKLVTASTLNGRGVAVVGVDWPHELALKGFWEVDGELPVAGMTPNPAAHTTAAGPAHSDGTSDHGDAATALVAGAALAGRLGLQPGQEAELAGRKVRVSAVLRPTGGEDDAVLFAPLALVQEMLGKPHQASFLEVAALCSGCPIDDIVRQLEDVLPGTEVRALRQVAESRMAAVHFAQHLAFYVSLVILITACAMIIMSMLSAVAERRREIGILRAVGFSRTGVFAVFVAEALGLGLAAGLVGYLGGQVLAGRVLETLHLADVSPQAFDPLVCSLTVLGVCLVAGCAAAFPAWKATLVEPAEALVAL